MHTQTISSRSPSPSKEQQQSRGGGGLFGGRAKKKKKDDGEAFQDRDDASAALSSCHRLFLSEDAPHPICLSNPALREEVSEATARLTKKVRARKYYMLSPKNKSKKIKLVPPPAVVRR